MFNSQLILQTGDVFPGTLLGNDRRIDGEVVFNTAPTGYQEIITDPSYRDQIIVFTQPMIGNYGILPDQFESSRPHCQAIVVQQLNQFTPVGGETLFQYLQRYHIPILSQVDTRRLTLLLREHGTLKGRITTSHVASEAVAQELTNGKEDGSPVPNVSTGVPYRLNNKGCRVVVIDFGVKQSILRSLHERGCDVIVVPYHTSAEQIMALYPDGVVLSNGPGDPSHLPGVLPTIRQLTACIPLLGICLGHQLMALAYGAKTDKLKFGHRGCNHPVRNLATQQLVMTAQNHSYVVHDGSLPSDLEITYRALHDQTIEGLRHRTAPAFSVQFHPEGGAGPTDTTHIFTDFISMMEQFKSMRTMSCQSAAT